jgi:hypothetical protein
MRGRNRRKLKPHEVSDFPLVKKDAGFALGKPFPKERVARILRKVQGLAPAFGLPVG